MERFSAQRLQVKKRVMFTLANFLDFGIEPQWIFAVIGVIIVGTVAVITFFGFDE